MKKTQRGTLMKSFTLLPFYKVSYVNKDECVLLPSIFRMSKSLCIFLKNIWRWNKLKKKAKIRRENLVKRAVFIVKSILRWCAIFISLMFNIFFTRELHGTVKCINKRNNYYCEMMKSLFSCFWISYWLITVYNSFIKY